MTAPRIVLLTGGHGMIGRNLRARYQAEGVEVRNLTRQPGVAGDFSWNPVRGELSVEAFQDVDAVVHLAGEGIAEERWTERRKREILQSRVEGTRLLAEHLAGLEKKPRVFLSASGAGYYPIHTGQTYDETGPPGKTFLAEVCRQWEGAAGPAVAAGVRTVFLRIGVVLHPSGGALARMLPVFQKGLGGPVGTGQQHLSWISLDDVIASILFCVENEQMKGPVNATAPESISNLEFSQKLGRALGKPAKLPAPTLAIKMMFGQMGEETVLADLRVRPGKLAAAGFQWKFRDPDSCLAALSTPANQKMA